MRSLARENIGDRSEFRQDAHKERHEFREDVHRERHEFYEDRWKWSVGASLTAATISALTCTRTTTVVGKVTYTQCGTHWYQRQYTGGNVTYIVVNAPAGY